MKRIKGKSRFWIELVMPVTVFLLMGCLFFYGVGDVSVHSEEEGKRTLQDALKRAAVQCYSIEGMYPPDVEYLEDHYGIIYNHQKYIVHYEAFASNIIPDIVVIPIDQD